MKLFSTALLVFVVAPQLTHANLMMEHMKKVFHMIGVNNMRDIAKFADLIPGLSDKQKVVIREIASMWGGKSIEEGRIKREVAEIQGNQTIFNEEQMRLIVALNDPKSTEEEKKEASEKLSASLDENQKEAIKHLFGDNIIEGLRQLPQIAPSGEMRLPYIKGNATLFSEDQMRLIVAISDKTVPRVRKEGLIRQLIATLSPSQKQSIHHLFGNGLGFHETVEKLPKMMSLYRAAGKPEIKGNETLFTVDQMRLLVKLNEKGISEKEKIKSTKALLKTLDENQIEAIKHLFSGIQLAVERQLPQLVKNVYMAMREQMEQRDGHQ